MQDSDQVLSQAEIDAMLNVGGGDLQAAAQAPPPPPPQPVAEEPAPAPPAPPTPPASPSTAGLGQDEIQSLSQRIAGLEESVLRLDSKAEPDSGPSFQQLSQQLQQLYADLQEINGKVDSMMETLQATVGYGVRTVFACKSCESQGNVAARLTCTSCGTEEWWGWFPPQE